MQKRTTKKTIKGRIFSSAFATFLALSIIISTVCVYAINRVAVKDSNEIITKICENEVLRFENRLDMVSHSVDMIYKYAHNIDIPTSIEESDISAYNSKIEEFALSIANNTDDVIAVYFHLDPEVTGRGTDGFLWTREANTDTFHYEYPRDISSYDESDDEHVGWFYVAKRTKEALWMKPYYNDSVKNHVISYVIPLYSKINNQFMGVVGMDIDFRSILEKANAIEVSYTGKVSICDVSAATIYSFENNKIVKSSIPFDLYDALKNDKNRLQIIKLNKIDAFASSFYCFDTLSNGMTIFVNMPTNDVYLDRNITIIVCICITLVIFMSGILFLNRRIRFIVKPLQQLTVMTNKYAEGDWSEQLVINTDDEIQQLAEGVSIMAKNTQEYISKINSLARTDALTGIGNKTAYFEKVLEINNNRHEKYSEFAVMIFDINFLKRVNDTYGHETGDILIKKCCNFICEIFDHSPIYRTGGDEFCGIIEGEDYQIIDVLLKRFEKEMNNNYNPESHTNISIAYGIAYYPKDMHDYESLYALADDRMYRKKKEMKAHIENKK